MGESRDNAVVLVSVDSVTTKTDVPEILSKIKGVKIVYEITGQHDIMVIVKSGGVDEINDTVDIIRRVEGVTNTDTVIILKKIQEQD